METSAATQSAPVTGAPCYRYLGGTQNRYVHPEGACACYHGGPGPVIVLVPPVPFGHHSHEAA